ncbi:MAG: VWA domain-containing protein, partial [Verrucomicrobiota bacterium]
FTTFSPLFWLLALLVLAAAWRFSLVDRPGPLKVASLALRVLAVVLLVLALCRPYWKEETEERHVVHLLDVSESVELGDVRAQMPGLREELEVLGSRDSYSLFLYGKGIRPMETVEELEELVSQWEEGIDDSEFRSESFLSAALQQSRIAFPAGKKREIRLWSDGLPTDEERLAEALNRLRDEDIDLQFSTLAGREEREAALLAITPTTTEAFENEVVRLRVDAMASEAMSARLQILHQGVVVDGRTVELEAGGGNRFTFDVNMTTPGPGQWTAELIPEHDFFPINNQLTTTITVRGQPRVLILHRKPQEMRPFVRLLEEQEFDVDSRGGRGLPESLEEMLAFDAILIADTPATDLTMRQMELLRRYVSDFGGGLGMLGSENSFGLGGYFKTPVEEVLPLTSRFEKEKEKPSLAMVLVIDKSGSMEGLPISLARQAAKATVELLGGRDQIAVIGFDSNPQVIVEMRPADDKISIQSSIDSLAAGGGTDVYPSMQLGREMLEGSVSKIKHMIILSDGQTQGADHLGLAQAMADSGITVSTVALGSGADRTLLSGIAEMGRGRYYETLDPSSVPQIFTKETMQASKSAIKEDLFGVIPAGDHPILSGYSEADLPFALGYVMTEVKPTAQLLLIAETGDPVLAVSRFGLGAGMAYSSDLTEMWGGEWLAWSEGGKFWAQVLRGIVRKADVEGLRTSPRVTGRDWVVDIFREDPDGSPVLGATWDAVVLQGSGKGEATPVEEVGLGHYRARVPLSDAGPQLSLRLHEQDSDKLKVLHYSQPYPAEYRLGGDVPESIRSLSEKAEEGEETKQFRHRSITHWFVYASMVCLLGGIVLRRI